MFVIKKIILLIIVYFNISSAYTDNNFNMPAHGKFIDFLIEGKESARLLRI